LRVQKSAATLAEHRWVAQLMRKNFDRLAAGAARRTAVSGAPKNTLYRKMRPCTEQSNGPVSLSPFPSWPGCIINTSGCDFRKGQPMVFQFQGG
jgi:hypothetical protein